MTTPPWQSAYRGQRVLVLGATGFIGRRIAATLASLGAEVIRGGRTPQAEQPDPLLVRVDLAVAGAAATVVATWQPAITFNLAGYGIDPGERDPEQARRINAELPAELADACSVRHGAPWPGLRLVHAGSALEYGTATGDLAETTVPRPTTLYGHTKLAGTQAVAAACADGRLAGATTRLFTVYGPGEPSGRLLPTLRQAARGTGPVPLTEGRQRRDFTFVDDVVEGLIRLGAQPAAGIGTVNLATGQLTSVREFVRIAAAEIGIAPARLGFGELPSRPEEMSHEPVSLGYLERLLGWRPGTTIAAGVKRTLERGATGA